MAPDINEKVQLYNARKNAEEAARNEKRLRNIFKVELEKKLRLLNHQHHLEVEQTKKDLNETVVSIIEVYVKSRDMDCKSIEIIYINLH